MVCTRTRIWIKYKHKQSLVKHNTPENFSLATDVSGGARFPQRYTCIAYADIDTVYLIYSSSLPRALFFVVSAPKVTLRAWWPLQAPSRSPNTKSAVKLPDIVPSCDYLHSNMCFRPEALSYAGGCAHLVCYFLFQLARSFAIPIVLGYYTQLLLLPGPFSRYRICSC